MRSNEFSSVNLICEQIKKVEKERLKVKKDLAHHAREFKRLQKISNELDFSHGQLKDVQAALSGRPLSSGGSLSGTDHQQIALQATLEGESLSAEGFADDNHDPELVSGLPGNVTSRDFSGSASNYGIITRKRQRDNTPEGAKSLQATPNTPPATPSKAGPPPNEYIWPYSTIIKTVGGQWVEIRCDVCGVNASTARSRFFTGWSGMFRHLKSRHDTSDRSENETPFDYVLRTCTYRDVPDFELEELKAGRAQIDKVLIPPGGTPKDGYDEQMVDDAVKQAIEPMATPYITQSPQNLMYAGIPMDEKPAAVQAQAQA